MIDMIQNRTHSAVLGMAEGASQVNFGVEMAEKTGTSMTQIDTSSREVSAIVEEISNTLREQKLVSNNITEKVDIIMKMIIDNATSDREVSELASRLEQQSSGS